MRCVAFNVTSFGDEMRGGSINVQSSREQQLSRSVERGRPLGGESLLVGAAMVLVGMLALAGSGLALRSAPTVRHIFPLKTTQAAIRRHRPTWCYNSRVNCHHDYPAADIFIDRGTVVRAIVAGLVITRAEVKRCTAAGGSAHLQLKGADGKYYFYTHLAPGSLRVKLHAHVKRGQQLGQVGGRACAEGTTPHLHIQMNDTVINGDGDSMNIQPRLIRLFDKLPAR
jgi:murein DD-endopeptidase MepM/ murein hydrolase activator NlpD